MTQSKRDSAAERWSYDEWLRLFGEDLIVEGVEVPVNVHKIRHSTTWQHLSDAFKSGFSAGRNEAIEEVLSVIYDHSMPTGNLVTKIKSLKEKV